MNKKVIGLLLLIFFIPCMVNALVEPSKILYITDEGNVLKKDTEEYIIQYSDFLSQQKGIHYYVVTVPSLEDYEMDDYADYVFDSFGVGKKGILIFFTRDEKMVQVILGAGISHIMDESEISDYIEKYMVPYLKNGESDKGIRNGYTAFYKRICDYYHLDASELEVLDGNELLTKYRFPIIMGIVVLGMLLGYAFCNFFRKIYSKTRRKKITFFDCFFFFICLFTNMGLLYISYLVEPWYLLILLGIELFTIMTMFNSSDMTLEEAFQKIKQEEARKSRRTKKRIVKKKRK